MNFSLEHSAIATPVNTIQDRYEAPCANPLNEDQLSYIYTNNEQGVYQIQLLDMNSGEHRTLLDHDRWIISHLDWGTNGSILFVDTSHRLFCFDVESEELTIIRDEGWTWNATYNPSASLIHFYDKDDGIPASYLMDLDGNIVDIISVTDQGETFGFGTAEWETDSTLFALVGSSQNESQRIVRYNVNSQELELEAEFGSIKTGSGSSDLELDPVSRKLFITHPPNGLYELNLDSGSITNYLAFCDSKTLSYIELVNNSKTLICDRRTTRLVDTETQAISIEYHLWVIELESGIEMRLEEVYDIWMYAR